MLFQYVARNKAGETIKGQIEAEDSKRALHVLRDMELFVLTLKRGRIQTSMRLFKRRASVKDLSLFCSQLSTMLKAGVPIIKTLSTVGEQTQNRVLKETISSMAKDLENGNTLSESVRKYDDVFPQVFQSLIEAGETGGVLDKVLERLANYFEGERELREKIKSAMTYPLFIGAFAIVAVIFMLTFMVPNFVAMFEEMGVGDKLPLITQILIGVSNFIQSNLILIGILTIVVILSSRIILQRPDIKIWWDYKKTQFPIFGKLIRKVAVARFCRTMSLLTASSVGIVTSLQLVSKAVSNDNFGEEILDVLLGIQEGGTLAKEFKDSKFVDKLTLQMLSVGEETGNIEEMLEKIGVYHEQDVKYTTERLASLVEPIMIILVAVMIAFILAAVMLPIFDLMQYI